MQRHEAQTRHSGNAAEGGHSLQTEHQPSASEHTPQQVPPGTVEAKPTSALRYAAQVDVSDKGTQPAQIVVLTGRNKKVLEVGPATGYITEVLQQRGCRVTAIEKDPVAADIAARFCERMIVGDVEEIDFSDTFPGAPFDVVVFGEVLEHLVNPHRALSEATKVLRPGGYVVASVPNVAHASVRLALLNGAFPYTETGLLDYTHLRFLTRKTLTDLFKQAGYVIRIWRRISADPFSTELNLRERDYPANLVASLRQDREAMTYQFVVKAVPAAGGRAVKEWTPAERPRLRPAGEPLNTLRRLEQDLSRQSAELKQKAIAVAERESLLAEKASLLAERDSQLAERDSQLAEKIRHIADLNSRLSATEEQLRHSRHELQVVASSLGYRLLEAYRRPVRWLFPPDSRRGLPYRALRRPLRWLMNRR